jgi:hypothetical protein
MIYPERLKIISEITNQKVDLARLLDIIIFLFQYLIKGIKNYLKEVLMKEGWSSIPRGTGAVQTNVFLEGELLGKLVNVLSLAEAGGEAEVFCVVRKADGLTGSFLHKNVSLVPAI